MGHQAAVALPAALLVMLGGCAPGPLDDRAWPESRPLGAALEAFRPARDVDAAIDWGDVDEPRGTISLPDALAAALRRSPDLAASGYEVRAREAEVIQAGLPPNPELAIEFENFAGTGELEGTDALETTLALSQLVELGGKRLKRVRVAEQEARLSGWDYEVRRIDVLSKTAADFITLLAAQRRSSLATETLALAQRVFDAVGERVEAGKVSPVERSKARVELAQAELAREQALRTVRRGRIRLASNWGSASPQFDDVQGGLDGAAPPPELESLLARIDASPDLARWSAEAALRQAQVTLALAQRMPDVTFTGGVRRAKDIDETALIAGLSFAIPALNRNQGGIRAARFRLMQNDRLEASARVQVHVAVADAFHVLDAAYVRVHTTREQILPSAEIAFEAAEAAFREGKIGALDLLDAERTLFVARQQLTDALTDYHLAVINAERLIGAPLRGGDQPQGDDR